MDRIGSIVYSDEPKSLAMATNLGHTALAMDTEVLVYFTFDGLTHLTAGETELGEFERMVEAGVPDPYGMLADLVESGRDLVTTVACTTTLDMLEWDRETLDDDLITRYAGAATFLEASENADHVFSFG
jgi:peroxiredoxin family protein